MMETRKPLLPVCPKVHQGATEEETVRAMAAEGLDRRMDAIAADAATRARYQRTPGLRTRRHRQDGFRRLLPDRRRLHPVGQGARHPGRPRPRLRRRLRRRLGADHHRPRPAALQPAVRALPQPGTRVDARLRHRLLPGGPRPGHRLCPQRIRRRPGGADHHLRQAAGARRGARRRPRARAAVRPGEQGRRADPQQSGHIPSPCSRRSTASPACASCATTTKASPACWKSRCRSRGCIATPPPTPPAW